MAKQRRDYYEVLGVARDADASGIDDTARKPPLLGRGLSRVRSGETGSLHVAIRVHLPERPSAEERRPGRRLRELRPEGRDASA